MYNRKSLLIQGGLKILVVEIIEMDGTQENKLAMDKYETMIGKQYKEPIEGEYEDTKAAFLQGSALRLTENCQVLVRGQCMEKTI